jgi:hypothetical protein
MHFSGRGSRDRNSQKRKLNDHEQTRETREGSIRDEDHGSALKSGDLVKQSQSPFQQLSTLSRENLQNCNLNGKSMQEKQSQNLIRLKNI